jgi:hypothetical protein
MDDLEEKLDKVLGLEGLVSKGSTKSASKGPTKDTMAHDYDKDGESKEEENPENK